MVHLSQALATNLLESKFRFVRYVTYEGVSIVHRIGERDSPGNIVRFNEQDNPRPREADSNILIVGFKKY